MPTSTSSRPDAGGRRLLVLGCGFAARRFVELHGAAFAAVAVTVRSVERAAGLGLPGVSVHLLAPDVPVSPELRDAASRATHVLVSVPPGPGGDTALLALGDVLAANAGLSWIGYLSTTGVYGDQQGRWIDETAPTHPTSGRAQRRLQAEEGWRALAREELAVQVFRLSGIYGPGRNALCDLEAGKARRLDKPGQVFNRIHIDDIAAVVAAALERPEAGPVFNLGDDEPAPQHEVVAFAAELLGCEPPPLTAFEQAELSEMARSFWAENKRLRNTRIKEELGVTLRFPTYRDGLRALHASGWRD